VLDEAGSVLLEQRVSTTPKALREVFGGMPGSASGSDADPGASGTGASADGAGQHGSRTGEVVRGACWLTDSMAASNGFRAACSSGLSPSAFSGFMFRTLHPRISKQGDPYLRTLLVQGAQHIVGPFGPDCDLRRWGLKLAERGGKSGKKRAIIATARKLVVLLHHLWGSGEVYEPLHHSAGVAMPAAA
jgi:hypothetical protein